MSVNVNLSVAPSLGDSDSVSAREQDRPAGALNRCGRREGIEAGAQGVRHRQCREREDRRELRGRRLGLVCDGMLGEEGRRRRLGLSRLLAWRLRCLGGDGLGCRLVDRSGRALRSPFRLALLARRPLLRRLALVL